MLQWKSLTAEWHEYKRGNASLYGKIYTQFIINLG